MKCTHPKLTLTHPHTRQCVYTTTWYFCIFATGCTVCPLPLVTVHLNETLCASNHRPRLAVWNVGGCVCVYVCACMRASVCVYNHFATSVPTEAAPVLQETNPFSAPPSILNFPSKELNPGVFSGYIHTLCVLQFWQTVLMYKLSQRSFEESCPLTLQAGAEKEEKENTGIIPRHNIL